MCTVTWRPAEGGYDLFFNRDELNGRAPELPPEISPATGGWFLAPRDGDRGGTWIAVNQHGLTVCLLNDYAAPWRPAGRRLSRGALVRDCAVARSAMEVRAIVEERRLENYGAFHLCVLSPWEEPRVLHWAGRELECGPAKAFPYPLTSSSFRTAEVVAARRRLFARLFAETPPSAEQLEDFHRMHDPAAGAFSVCMRRPDARTRSLTKVRVRAGEVTMDYEPVAWDASPGAPVILSLSRA